jgi:hypothetical protein
MIQMMIMRDDVIRAKLERYVFDGTETLEAIRFLLNSPNRPSDIMKAISKILQRQYRDYIDTVINFLDGDE